MTNRWSFEYLAAQEYHKLKRRSGDREWHELSPFEQNRMKLEALACPEAVAKVDTRLVRKGVREADRSALLKRRGAKAPPRVRIPPLPPT